MTCLLVLTLFALLSFRGITAVDNRTFPATFKFGVATASYQVEGAWNVDGKTENIWDHICHTAPTFVKQSHNGDVACDSYHKYKEDVQLIKSLGVQFYRFSLSWNRILPKGVSGSPVNPLGVDYYRNLIQELIKNNIEPVVTIFHWDLPQVLQDLGGFTNPDIVDHYTYFATTAFEKFGDLVKLWITFNEPKQTCQQGYGNGEMAPGFKASGIADYKCSHLLIKSHAAAFHAYNDKFRKTQGGRVGITIDTSWFEPATDSQADRDAAERTLQFNFGWYAHPIFHGDYPPVMRDRVATRSRSEGYAVSRLPKFTPEEVAYINGTFDFLGLNHYTTNMVEHQNEPNSTVVSWENDYNARTYQNETWEATASSWLRVVPWGFRKLLTWMGKNYNNTEIFITENGVSDRGVLVDDRRIDFYMQYLSSLLEAIHDDHVRVTRYTAWSLMDNFEWAQGYTEKYGLYAVNFTDPARTRTAKASATYFKKIVSTKCLVEKCR